MSAFNYECHESVKIYIRIDLNIHASPEVFLRIGFMRHFAQVITEGVFIDLQRSYRKGQGEKTYDTKGILTTVHLGSIFSL